MNVSFSLSATGPLTGANWTLEFGDASDESGSGADLPATVTHGYIIGGNFSASLKVTYSDGKSATSDAIVITVTVDAGAEPPQLVFSYGASAGCAWDTAMQVPGGPALPCISEAGGPDASGIDGFWQPLDARYWGMPFSSTITRGGESGSSADDWPLYDSDCFFFAEDHVTRTGEANNGGAACGTADGVPVDTMWMFILPYGAPAEGMDVTFGVPPA